MGGVDDQELERKLFEAGKRLEHPPTSKAELLQALENVETYLFLVNRLSPESILCAMLPSMNSLINPQLMSHGDKDVRLLVISCFIQITKITVPNEPYNEDTMREIFELIVGSFQELGDMKSPSFARRFAILVSVAALKSCVMMVDLGLDHLIFDRFKHFFTAVSHHSYSADLYDSMKTIMCSVLDGSDDISQELLSVLLTNLRDSSPAAAHSLSLKVVTSSAEKLRPYLRENLPSNEAICGHGYHQIVYDICRRGSQEIKPNQNTTASEDVIFLKGGSNEEPGASCLDISNPQVLSSDDKRNDKKKIMNDKLVSSTGGRKERPTKRSSRFREETESKDVSLTEYTASEANSNLAVAKSLNRDRPPRKSKRINNLSAVERTVEGCGEDEKIKVWWPLDKQFYEGIVESYNPKSKKHAISYSDGDREELQLSKERWDFIDQIPSTAKCRVRFSHSQTSFI